MPGNYGCDASGLWLYIVILGRGVFILLMDKILHYPL